jgi:hypothetical protein
MIGAKNKAAETLPCTRMSGGAERDPASSTWVVSREVVISSARTPEGSCSWDKIYWSFPHGEANARLW